MMRSLGFPTLGRFERDAKHLSVTATETGGQHHALGSLSWCVVVYQTVVHLLHDRRGHRSGPSRGASALH